MLAQSVELKQSLHHRTFTQLVSEVCPGLLLGTKAHAMTPNGRRLFFFLVKCVAEQVMVPPLCRGTVVAHPMEVEGTVAGFSPFHNVNCAQVLLKPLMHCLARYVLAMFYKVYML